MRLKISFLALCSFIFISCSSNEDSNEDSSDNPIDNSSNNSQNWKLIKLPIDIVESKALATSICSDETNMYFSTPDNGVYKTTDGTSWKQINKGVKYPKNCYIYYIDGILYLRTYLPSTASTKQISNIYKSIDKGENWTPICETLESFNLYVDSISIIGSNIAVATAGDLYLSYDNGVYWYRTKGYLSSVLNSKYILGEKLGLEILDGTYNIANDGTNFVAIGDQLGNIYTKNGNYFKKTGSTNGSLSGVSLTSIGKSFYQAHGSYGDNIIKTSKDGGINWTAYIDFVKKTNQSVLKSLYASGSKLYVGSESSVYVIPDINNPTLIQLGKDIPNDNNNDYWWIRSIAKTNEYVFALDGKNNLFRINYK